MTWNFIRRFTWNHIIHAESYMCTRPTRYLIHGIRINFRCSVFFLFFLSKIIWWPMRPFESNLHRWLGVIEWTIRCSTLCTCMHQTNAIKRHHYQTHDHLSWIIFIIWVSFVWLLRVTNSNFFRFRILDERFNFES